MNLGSLNRNKLTKSIAHAVKAAQEHPKAAPLTKAKPLATAAPAAPRRIDFFERVKSAVTKLGSLSPQRAAAPATAAAAPASASRPSAAEGARHVEEAYRRGGALEGSRELRRQAEVRKDDPAAVAELVRAARPTIDSISRELADRAEHNKDDSHDKPVTKESVRALSEVAEMAGPEGTREIARSLATALPNKDDLNQFDDAFNELDHEGKGATLALALSGELRAQCKHFASAQIEKEAFDAIGNLRDELGDTRGAREEMDNLLYRQLDEFRDVLTPEQQQKYIEAFHEEHKDVYKAEAEAAQRLSNALSANVDTLNQAAMANPDRVDDVVGAFKDLANSSLPAAAVEWAAKTFADGSPTAQVFTEHREEISKEIVEKGMAGTLTQYQGEAGGDSASALQRMEKLYGDFGKAKKLFDSPATFEGAMKRGRELLDAFHAVEAGNAEPLRKLIADSEKLKGFSDPLSSGMAVAGLAFAVVNLRNADDVTSLVQGVAGVGSAGLSLASKAIGSLNESGRLVHLLGESGAERAVGFAKFANRLVPGISLGVNALATAQSVMDLIHDGKASNVLKVIGDGISLVGSAASFIPVLAPIGGAISFVGAAISELANAIGGAEDRSRFNAEQKKLLNIVLADELQGRPEALEEVVDQLADASPDLNAIKNDAGLTQKQFFDLLEKVEDSNDRGFPLLVEVAASVGLQGQAFVDAIQRLDDRYDGDLILPISDVATWMSNLTTLTPEDRQEALRQMAKQLELV